MEKQDFFHLITLRVRLLLSMKLELTPVVRYWELHSKEIFATLDELHKLGAKSIAAWVPWAHLETDRHHLLQKFVKQALIMGFELHLGITPEIGIGYPNGGIPDDLLRDRQNLAQDRSGQIIYSCAPPNIHPIVSLLAPPVFQRYGHFLLKFTQELTEIFQEGFSGKLNLVVSDSFFKHYHNIGMSSDDHGDYSMRHVQFSGTFKKEEWTPILAERLFHSRAADFLHSRFQKNKNVKVVSKKIFSRSPSLDRLLEELSGTGMNVSGFFQKMTASRSICDLAWLDDLSLLKDRERNFLISSALIFYGELWLTKEDYLACSQGFRKKMEKIIQVFSVPETKQIKSATVIVENRFSPARFSTVFLDKLGSALQIKMSIFDLSREELASTKLLAIEEGFKLELNQSLELFRIAKENDSTVVVFRSSLCKKAQKEIENFLSFSLNHQWQFDISLFPDGGQVIVVDGKNFSKEEEKEANMSALGDSLLSVAKIDPWCHYDKYESKVSSLSINWTLRQGSMKTLFLFNPEREAKNLCLEFAQEVNIHGLKMNPDEVPGLGKNFEVTLPPLSAIPLSIFFEHAQAHKKEELENLNTKEGLVNGRKQAELA